VAPMRFRGGVLTYDAQLGTRGRTVCGPDLLFRRWGAGAENIVGLCVETAFTRPGWCPGRNSASLKGPVGRAVISDLISGISVGRGPGLQLRPVRGGSGSSVTTRGFARSALPRCLGPGLPGWSWMRNRGEPGPSPPGPPPRAPVLGPRSSLQRPGFETGDPQGVRSVTHTRTIFHLPLKRASTSPHLLTLFQSRRVRGSGRTNGLDPFHSFPAFRTSRLFLLRLGALGRAPCCTCAPWFPSSQSMKSPLFAVPSSWHFLLERRGRHRPYQTPSHRVPSI